MKITGFNTSILTQNPDDIVRVFKDLGFEESHSSNAEEGIVSGSVRLKYGDFRLDVVSTDHFPSDKSLIRMNVDDLDETYQLMLDHGFHSALGEDAIIEAEHFRGAHMVSPSGFEIMIMQHIKSSN